MFHVVKCVIAIESTSKTNLLFFLFLASFSYSHVKYVLNLSSILEKVSLVIRRVVFPLRDIKERPGLRSTIIINKVLVFGIKLYIAMYGFLVPKSLAAIRIHSNTILCF